MRGKLKIYTKMSNKYCENKTKIRNMTNSILTLLIVMDYNMN